MRIAKPFRIVIDLLSYDYEFGNDLFALFLIGVDRATGRVCPVCVVAEGRTRSALQTLLQAGNAQGAFEINFVASSAEALAWVSKSVLGSP